MATRKEMEDIIRKIDLEFGKDPDGDTPLEDLDSDEIKEIYDEYGLRNLSRSQVEQLAEKRSAPKLEKLRKDFQEQGIGNLVLVKGKNKQGEIVEKAIPRKYLEAAKAKGFKVI